MMPPLIRNSLQKVREACATTAQLCASAQQVSAGADAITRNLEVNGVRLDGAFGPKRLPLIKDGN